MSLIDTTVFPGDQMSPDALVTAAAAIRDLGVRVEARSRSVLARWRGLPEVYDAPETHRAVASMVPVVTSATATDRQLAQTAAALERFAVDVRTIKRALESVRTDANDFLRTITDGCVSRTTAFRGDPRGTAAVPWTDDPTAVMINNRLVAAVNEQQVLLWAAERRCASAIGSLTGSAPVRVATEGTCGRGYGVEQVADGTSMPWGAVTAVPERCADGVLRGVTVAALGAVVGTVNLAGLANPTADPAYAWGHGIDLSETTWDEQTALGAWRGLGTALAGAAGEELALSVLPGPVGAWFRQAEQQYDAAKRDLVALDEWGTDPAAAAGTVAFNLGALGLGVSRVGRSGVVLESPHPHASAPVPPVGFGGHGSLADELGSDLGPVSGRPYRADRSGGPTLVLSIDRMVINENGVNTVRRHLDRFDPHPGNTKMLERLDAIVRGDLVPTTTDKNFYAHELRESVRYRKRGYALGVAPSEADAFSVWNDLHTAALEDYRLREGDGILYVTETTVKGDR